MGKYPPFLYLGNLTAIVKGRDRFEIVEKPQPNRSLVEVLQERSDLYCFFTLQPDWWVAILPFLKGGSRAPG